MNLATVIVLLVVLGLVALAISTLRKGKGSCSCSAENNKKAGGQCASCNVDCPFKSGKWRVES
jgi:hypothetical protein